MCEVARLEYGVPWRRVLCDNSRGLTMGVAREKLLASGTIFAFYVENINIHWIKKENIKLKS